MASKVKKNAFKVLDVKTKISIKKFLEGSKEVGTFTKGKAFYQMTKGEVIQDYKKVVVMRTKDKQFVTGEGVRTVLKMPAVAKGGKEKFVLDLDELPDFEVFVQSTSYNRAVLPGTKVLYQMEDDIEDVDMEEDKEEEGEEEEEEKPVKRATRGRKAALAKKPAPAPKKKAAPKRKAAVRKVGEKRDDSSDEEEDDAPSSPKAAKPTAAAATAPPPPGSPPDGAVEIAFSFDTTGSMYACLGEVRRAIQDTIKRLQKDIPGIRMAVIAHGDYCDAHSYYVTKQIDFTTDCDALCKFVRDVGSTGGGDADECYELVLREAHTKLTWTPGTQRSLVMIGDSNPHGVSYPMNKQKICWKKECAVLKTEGVRIYAVQALSRGSSDNFYKTMAQLTGGYHLKLAQFSSIINFIMAICYCEQGPDQLQSFEDEIRGASGGGINRELHNMFDNLAGRTPTTFAGGAGADFSGGATAGTVTDSSLKPVATGRFQVLSVDSKCSIKEFVSKNSLLFKAGRGFYEFTKAEVISAKKEVVLVDKTTGDMFAGPEAARAIGAGGSARIKPTALTKYRVFVQSTSYNRSLVGGTGFLYEVDEDH